VREIGELCFALYTPEGDAISLSTGIMAHVHTMSMSMSLEHMVRSDYELNPGIKPGDIFVHNDPQLGNVHNADVMDFLPIGSHLFIVQRQDGEIVTKSRSGFDFGDYRKN